MSLQELRDAIAAMEAARAAVFTVGLRIDDACMGRSAAAYITDLNFTLDSCRRALAQRLADGEEDA